VVGQNYGLAQNHSTARRDHCGMQGLIPVGSLETLGLVGLAAPQPKNQAGSIYGLKETCSLREEKSWVDENPGAPVLDPRAGTETKTGYFWGDLAGMIDPGGGGWLPRRCSIPRAARRGGEHCTAFCFGAGGFIPASFSLRRIHGLSSISIWRSGRRRDGPVQATAGLLLDAIGGADFCRGSE